MDGQPITRYEDWIGKKLSDKPTDARAFLRRTYRAGVDVLGMLAGVPPKFLSLTDYTQGKHMQLYRKYEALLKTAAGNPDQFVYTLHQKLTETARYIRKNSLFSEFHEFSSMIFRIRTYFIMREIGVGTNAASAYAELVLATFRYLAPEDHDDSRLLCGCSTEGEPLYCDTCYPYAGEIRALASRDRGGEGGAAPGPEEAVRGYAAEYGYTDIVTEKDLDGILAADRSREEQIACLSPYINEYTYDMVPGAGPAYRTDTRALEMTEALLDPAPLVDSLSARSRTLPVNGIRYDLSYDPHVPEEARLRSLFLKEVFHRDRIVLLYRLRNRGQDLCGYYDLKDQFLYSRFVTDPRDVDHRCAAVISCLVLYLYSAAVTPDGEQMLRGFWEHFLAGSGPGNKNRYPVSVTAHPLGGELRNTYEDREGPAETPGDGEEGEDGRPRRTLQGYIRKLAPGETPSGEDRARAGELGFAPAADEIYVGPFLK